MKYGGVPAQEYPQTVVTGSLTAPAFTRSAPNRTFGFSLWA